MIYNPIRIRVALGFINAVPSSTTLPKRCDAISKGLEFRSRWSDFSTAWNQKQHMQPVQSGIKGRRDIWDLGERSRRLTQRSWKKKERRKKNALKAARTPLVLWEKLCTPIHTTGSQCHNSFMISPEWLTHTHTPFKKQSVIELTNPSDISDKHFEDEHASPAISTP